MKIQNILKKLLIIAKYRTKSIRALGTRLILMRLLLYLNMKIIYFIFAIVFCLYNVSCKNPPQDRPIKKVVIKGVITHKTDYGLIPETGSTVYALEKKYSGGINDTMISEFNWTWYAYMKYLKLKSEPWGKNLAQKWKTDQLSKIGINGDKDFDTIMAQTVHYGMCIVNGVNVKKTTINANGEYSLYLDSGTYFIMVNSSDRAGGYYGGWVNTRDSISDFSKNLWYAN
jgi:hypothetical protein